MNTRHHDFPARRPSGFLPVALTFLFVTAALTPALTAQETVRRPSVKARAAVLLDADTGAVLYSKSQDEPIPPASLTKLVTIYITERMIESGKLSRSTPVSISENAWAMNLPNSSLMFLEPGQRVTVGELLQGLAVVSGNDAAIALAELISGSEREFARLMNSTMRDLGFTATRFVDASGFDGLNMTTAREFAEFCRLYIRKFPENLKNLHSVREMTYPLPRNMPVDRISFTKPIHQYNRNSLLWNEADVDGLKTGFVNEAGYNFAVTAKRNGMRLVLVTLGGPGRSAAEGSRIRGQDAIKLLGYGFDNFTHYETVEPRLLPVRIWKGKKGTIVPSFNLPPLLTVPKGSEVRLSIKVRQKTELTAPVAKGESLGELAFYDGSAKIYSVPLSAGEAVERGGVFTRMLDSVKLFFRGLTGRKVELEREYAPVPAGI